MKNWILSWIFTWSFRHRLDEWITISSGIFFSVKEWVSWLRPPSYCHPILLILISIHTVPIRLMTSFKLVNRSSCTLLLFRYNFTKDFVWMKRLHLCLLPDIFSSSSQSTYLLTLVLSFHFGKPSWAVCSFSGTLTAVSNISWYQEVVLWYTLTKRVYGTESRDQYCRL